MPPIAGLFAYVGPDTFLPVSSALAAAAGVFMMFGRAGIRLIVQGGVARVFSGRRRLAGPHTPRQLRRTVTPTEPADASRAED